MLLPRRRHTPTPSVDSHSSGGRGGRERRRAPCVEYNPAPPDMVTAYPFPGPLRAWGQDHDPGSDWVKIDPTPSSLYLPLTDEPRRAFDDGRLGQVQTEDKGSRRPRSKLGLSLSGLTMARKSRTEAPRHPPPPQQQQLYHHHALSHTRDRQSLPLPPPPPISTHWRSRSHEQVQPNQGAENVRPPRPMHSQPDAEDTGVADDRGGLGRRVMGLRTVSGVSSWRGVKQQVGAALKGQDKVEAVPEPAGPPPDTTPSRRVSTRLGKTLRRVASSERRETMGYRRESVVPLEGVPRVASEEQRRTPKPGSIRSFMTTIGHSPLPPSAGGMPSRTPSKPPKQYAMSVYTPSSYTLAGRGPLPSTPRDRVRMPSEYGSRVRSRTDRHPPLRNPLQEQLCPSDSSVHHFDPTASSLQSTQSSPASMTASLPPQLPPLPPLSLSSSAPAYVSASPPLPPLPLPPLPSTPLLASRRVPSLAGLVSPATTGSRSFPAPNIDEVLLVTPIQASPPDWPETDGGLSPLSSIFPNGGGRTPSVCGSVATSMAGSMSGSFSTSMYTSSMRMPLTPSSAGWYDSPREKHLAPAKRVWRDAEGKEVRAVYKVGYERAVLDAEARLHETMYEVAGGRHSFVGGDPASILDIGTGTGLWPIWAAGQWPHARVVAADMVPAHIDVSELAAAEGRRRTSATGEEGASTWTKVASRVEFQYYNFLDGLPYPAGEFDIVHIRFVGLGVPETQWAALVDEAVRVLRPGGILEIWEMSYEPPPGTAPCVATAYGAALLADVVPQNPLHALQLNLPATAAVSAGATRPVFQISWPAARDGSTAQTTEPGAPAMAPAAILDAAPTWIRSVLGYAGSGVDAVPGSDTGARAAAALAEAYPDRWGARFRDDDGTPPPPVPKECPATPTSPTIKKPPRPTTLVPNPAAGTGRIALAAWVVTKA